jgi:hypothetical protein
VTIFAFERIWTEAALFVVAVGPLIGREWRRLRRVSTGCAAALLLVVAAALGSAQNGTATKPAKPRTVPPRVAQAERFMAQRGWGANANGTAQAHWAKPAAIARPQTSAGMAAWQSLGPTAVISQNFGLVTGRIPSIAFDPADPSGNTVYLATTSGVWRSVNAAAADASTVVFTPLTDSVSALAGVPNAPISVGAITVQPGGTGVILAGTGDPNDGLDSYYGEGILRSEDGGTTWRLTKKTGDLNWAFTGEGFAGFAWSTLNPQLVVAAITQAYATTPLVPDNPSYEGLYYSTDAGATWSLATIRDPSGADVQGPGDPFVMPDGNAATAVVWNPVRNLFIAAVRYHGYYQSTDGATWTRLASQPGSELTTQNCPTNRGHLGSIDCPILRGALAVNPITGDTLAWTVDSNNQDQGIWQDQCAISGKVCTNANIAFGTQLNTAALETNDPLLGTATIENGDYDMTLAAVPSGQDTKVLAGANDLWECSLALGCSWRNATNANTCMSAQVAEYQHALAWNAANPLEIAIGNDGGLWRSMDAVGESGSVCDGTDAGHFQNLNGGLGPLAEVENMSQATASAYVMMAGLGANGTAGVKNTVGPTAQWPEILGGEGGPVAIDPTNGTNWYVNNMAGVSIHLCSQTDACTAAAFGDLPVVTDADVGGDGYTMLAAAPFLIDPLDATQLLIGTCRVWRGAANGSMWSNADAISPFLDGVEGERYCDGDALIRSMAAAPLPNGGEVIYVGMYGPLDGGAMLAGHVLSATFDPASNSMPVWNDLTMNPVTNQTAPMNGSDLDISSIYIDPHDPSGETIYVTIEGIPSLTNEVWTLFSSVDGGAHWMDVSSNLPWLPANSVVVDPQDANTVYVATDGGVFSTRQIESCSLWSSSCWTLYGAGLPEVPVVQLSATPSGAQLNVLVAGTYGRGVWQIPLWTAGMQLTTATLTPSTLTFGSQAYGTQSSAQTLTLTNTGGIALTPGTIAVSGDFSETDDCQNVVVNADASCTIEVTFTPTEAGVRSGQLTIPANIAGGQLTVTLSGTGDNPGVVVLAPTTLNFGAVAMGATSEAINVTVENGGAVAIPISNVSVTAPYIVSDNACGGSVAAEGQCTLSVEFAPTATGAANGTLTIVDGAGTQTAALNGTGAAPATDTLSATTLAFAATIAGQASAAQTVTLTNSGGMMLLGIAASVSGPFQVTNHCGTQLVAASNCAISVVFDPTTTGAQTGVLTVADAIRSQTVALSGTSLQPPVLSISPTSLSFSAEAVGAASAPLTLTVSNTGGTPMANVSFEIVGASASSFATGVTTCGGALNNGSSCTVQVIFAPVTTGGSTATLTVSSSTAGTKTVQVPLSGAGGAANAVQLEPASLSFGTTGVGEASSTQVVTVTNTGTVDLNGFALSVSGAFELVNNSCTATLAAGASCTAGVVFAPLAAGPQTGALTASSSTLPASVQAPLAGMGFDFTAAVADLSGQTVASGQSANYTVILTPLAGSAGTFTMQCGGLPANSICSFSPANETVGANGTGNVAVQVMTGHSVASMKAPEGFGWGALTAICGLMTVPLVWKRRWNFVSVILLGIVACAASGCVASGGGTGGKGGQGSNGTPPGNYAIQVTATANGISHAVILTLTVD